MKNQNAPTRGKNSFKSFLKFLFLFLVASNNDPSVLNKYKQGYSECVQECLKFVNNTNNPNPQTNGIDSATRQRLIANLMRQYQTINSTGQIASPVYGNYTQPMNKFNSSIEETSQNALIQVRSQLSPIGQMPPSPDNSNNLTSDNSSFRRSSVSPISASSSCSFKSQIEAYSNTTETNCANISTENILINSENLNSYSSSSPKILESSLSSSSAADDQNVWRPW